MTLSQRIVTIFAITGTVCASATLRRVIVLRIGRKFNPFQIIAVHKGTGVGLVRQPLPFGCELHAHRLHLLVEVRQILHALRVERVAEIAQPLDVDALACAMRVCITPAMSPNTACTSLLLTVKIFVKSFAMVSVSTGLPCTTAWG